MFKLKQLPTPGTKVSVDQFAELLCRHLLIIPQIFKGAYLKEFLTEIDESFDYYNLGNLGMRKLNFEFFSFILYYSLITLINNNVPQNISIAYSEKFKLMLETADRAAADAPFSQKDELFHDFKNAIIIRLDDYRTIFLHQNDELSINNYYEEVTKKFVKNILGYEHYDRDKQIPVVLTIINEISDTTQFCLDNYPIKKGFW